MHCNSPCDKLIPGTSQPHHALHCNFVNVLALYVADADMLLQIAACVSEEGKLRAVGCDSRWLLEARLADDCHSYNVLLQRGVGGNNLVLYVVKSIRNGEELQLWFSEQMLVVLAVPFLTPLNIQGITKLNFLTSAWRDF
jgi:hypothetical protein